MCISSASLGCYWVLGIDEKGCFISGGIRLNKGEHFGCEYHQPDYGACIGWNRLLAG